MIAWNGKRKSFVCPQLRGRRSEHAPAKFALPQLYNLQLFSARALTDEARTAAVRAACWRFDGGAERDGRVQGKWPYDGRWLHFTMPSARYGLRKVWWPAGVG